MADRLTIVIDGEPLAKPRPKAQRRGGNVHIYTPDVKGTDEIERELANYRGAFVGKVALTFLFYGAHGSKDVDNLVKMYVDHLVKAEVITGDRWRIVTRIMAEAFEVDVLGKRTVIVVERWRGGVLDALVAKMRLSALRRTEP